MQPTGRTHTHPPRQPSRTSARWHAVRIGASYQQYTLTLTATGVATDLRFTFFHEPAFFYLDDVSVSVRATGSVPEPGTLGLAGVALAALGGAWRRRRRPSDLSKPGGSAGCDENPGSQPAVRVKLYFVSRWAIAGSFGARVRFMCRLVRPGCGADPPRSMAAAALRQTACSGASGWRTLVSMRCNLGAPKPTDTTCPCAGHAAHHAP